MNWSEKLIDLAGQNFDILGSHNYEYEPENYATGVRRIEDYLEKLVEYVRRSAHPSIEIAVLEWGAARTYDWRAGLHAAGSLLSYEKLSPALALSSPALLMAIPPTTPSGARGSTTTTCHGSRVRDTWPRSCFATTTRPGGTPSRPARSRTSRGERSSSTRSRR